MTPKEKAKELVSKMLLDHDMPYDLAQECALIAVDEIQQLIKNLSTCKSRFIYIIHEMNYFEEVKQEIEKL